MSIFVNPAQFAPHEDLATYPRTLPKDLELLTAESLSVSHPSLPELFLTRKPSAVFLPTVSEMYPSGISQDTSAQKGTFVEVKGYGHQMEGQSRPTFFRGVATVVTKLFNVIEVCPIFGKYILSYPMKHTTADKHIFWSKRYSTGTASATSFERPPPISSGPQTSPHCTNYA